MSKKSYYNSCIKRWDAVHKIETEELAATPLKKKFKQAVSIYLLAVGLGLTKLAEKDKGTKAVIARWRLLKAVLK